MSGDVERWGDAQQYRAEPHGSYVDEEHGVMPRVTLLWMTPDPLGAVAAMAAMYEGRVVRDLSELSHEDRVRYWTEVRKTHLDTPLEAVTFQFLLEGVDRSFTHQLVRKRVGTAFAQESLRFAVPGRLSEASSLPPSLQGTHHPDPEDGGWDVSHLSQEQRHRNEWDYVMNIIDRGYHRLVANGMPAEEARGLLPHATATRVVYLVNLRSLLQEAGNRLCTQAQFHWKIVMAQMVRAIREFNDNPPPFHQLGWPEWAEKKKELGLVADAFRPVCYEMGRCPFKAGFDRDCSIRERVDSFAANGVPSSQWGEERQTTDDDDNWIKPIRPEEWLMNPAAARRRS